MQEFKDNRKDSDFPKSSKDDDLGASDNSLRPKQIEQILEGIALTSEQKKELANYLIARLGDKEIADDEVHRFDEERQHVKEIILPKLEGEISILQRRYNAIANHYDLLEPELPVDQMLVMDNESRQEFKKLISLAEANLPKQVLGQEHAITPIISALKRAAVGIRNQNRPMLSVLEVGRTGVGKTLVAKCLADELAKGGQVKFDFLKIDCSEYSSGHEGGRLVGAPPGYIGFDQGGQFDSLKDNPFHVVLFDEIEKGSRQLHNMLLQILEDGEITMSDGQVISFRNCIIIMTSNVGVEAMDKALNPMGYTTSSTKRSLDQEDVLNLATDALKREFAPEFLNRLDGVIAFKDLDREIAKSIVMLELDKLKDRIVMNYLGCTLKISDAVVEELLNLGFSPEYGAREIRRAVERYIEDPLAQKMFGLDDTTIVISEFRADIKRGKIEINRREQGPPIPVIDTASFYDNPLPIH